MAQRLGIDEASLPSVFQAAWKSNPDPTALPFPRADPPFPLTPLDWKQLTLTDAQFTPHSWEHLHTLISSGQLDKLKRWPSALKAYLAWTAHVKEKYGSATAYLLQQRLLWQPLEDVDGELKFEICDQTPFADDRDYKVLRNDWPYALEPGVQHIVVWLKGRLSVGENGALDEEGRKLVDRFVDEKFRLSLGEEREGSRVIWFKNTTNLQSVRSLEHVHVLVRDVDDEMLERWSGQI
ncbi:hypothetical protein P153DRAFT_383610 [Dothidotthia symphoricarpi CBS 119687]|uniref:N-acetylglucosamine-induced protein 1 n=1 Tax=Dothidotthia symphoricarpi CBS 119687 TaxID=1392245 RepID=A0A6A6AI76_9PLEO|nr:uncharacterized protein P153DRAFT_383610 [Dothidotthia symphoricarpi CBS 119687]KAF2131510.1 hypothetical protein P153DRAFT_383610 [Dothidotthia symphoricarpi CBS 119687]